MFASTIFAVAVGVTSLGAALFVNPAPASADLLAEPVAIFAGPGYTYASVAGAGAGDWLTVDGPAVDGWIPVTYYGISGWIEQSSLEPGTEYVPAPEGYYDFLNEDEAAADSGSGDGQGGDSASASDGSITGGDTAASGDESAAAGSGGPATVSDAPATSDPSQVESSAAGQDGQDQNAQGDRRQRDDGASSGTGTGGESGSSPISEASGGYDLVPPAGQSTVAGATSEYSEAQLLGYISEAAAKYGQDPAVMERVARCESGLNPYAIDPASLYYGLFQFVPETFAQTPYGQYDIFDPWASAMATGWMWEQGRKAEWVCQ